jgi:hypothetical protein
MKNRLRGLDLSIGIRNSKRILQFGEARWKRQGNFY